MPYASAETISEADFGNALKMLEPLLVNLPTQLPSKTGSDSTFQAFVASPFTLDEKYFELTEDEVSEMLKRCFGWQTRSTGHGIVAITERGPGICAVAGVHT